MNKEQLTRELNFKAIRSSGSGGQHVNKVSSKIELSFNIKDSLGLTNREKETLYKSIPSKITKNNTLIIFCDESRSQHKNKELAIKRFLELISKKSVRQKFRKVSKPTRGSILRKRESKQSQSLKKSLRKKISL